MLIVALLSPVAVFSFLKFFGRNEFDIPVYHLKKTGAAFDDCTNITYPYKLHADSLRRLGLGSGPAVLFFDAQRPDSLALARVREEFGESVLVGSLPGTPAHRCTFLLTDSARTLLIDTEGKIRGYYHTPELEEADRLIVELKILLKQY
jgi:hypothetical protein